MIKTYNMLIKEYSNYEAPENKISRMVKEHYYIKVKKGIYETDKSVPGYLLANIIYGPSYLSFDYALSYYGLIPEAVYVFTSACFEKKKQKKYNTDFGTFTYRDIPSIAFPYGVHIVQEGQYTYHIATAEKALCDKLYSMPTVRNKKQLRELIFEDLRIDQDEFDKLNKDDLKQLSDLYHCTNLKILKKLLRVPNE
ncbi:MAG: hypothetical protein RR428_07555 [Coprobacillus sp.]